MSVDNSLGKPSDLIKPDKLKITEEEYNPTYGTTFDRVVDRGFVKFGTKVIGIETMSKGFIC